MHHLTSSRSAHLAHAACARCFVHSRRGRLFVGVNGSYNIRTRHGGREQVGHGARTDATMWRVADRNVLRGQAADARERSEPSVSLPCIAFPPIHPCCCNPYACKVPQLCNAERSVCSRGCRKVGHAHRGGKWAQASSDASTIDATACGGTRIGAASGRKRRAMRPQSTRRRVGARTSGRQVGASVGRCVHNRRDGVVHGGDTHLGSAIGHKQGDVRTSDTRAWGT
mmetsp:Transcript_34512/g.90299  ORF Transcript_34512/g.90299 Transcript_34512/m.90299 type:complete len:226 (-) Transcript_34512:553-1230(-)